MNPHIAKSSPRLLMSYVNCCPKGLPSGLLSDLYLSLKDKDESCQDGTPGACVLVASIPGEMTLLIPARTALMP